MPEPAWMKDILLPSWEEEREAMWVGGPPFCTWQFKLDTVQTVSTIAARIFYFCPTSPLLVAAENHPPGFVQFVEVMMALIKALSHYLHFLDYLFCFAFKIWTLILPRPVRQWTCVWPLAEASKFTSNAVCDPKPVTWCDESVWTWTIASKQA